MRIIRIKKRHAKELDELIQIDTAFGEAVRNLCVDRQRVVEKYWKRLRDITGAKTEEIKFFPKTRRVEYPVVPSRNSTASWIIDLGTGAKPYFFEALGMVGFGGIKLKDCACGHLKMFQCGNEWAMSLPDACEKCGPHEPVSVRFWERIK